MKKFLTLSIILSLFLFAAAGCEGESLKNVSSNSTSQNKTDVP